MSSLTLENLLILSILILVIAPIVFSLINILQKIFKQIFSPLINANLQKKSTYQDFDFRDSFYDNNESNEPKPSNYQTINIYSVNSTPNPLINISLKSIHNQNDESIFTFETNNEKLERLMTYGRNFCRSSYNLKWENKFLKKIGYRDQKFSFLITHKIRDENKQALITFLPSNFCKLKMDELIIRNSVKNFMETIKHTNIQPLIRFDIDENLKFFISVRSFENYSLKDLIYDISDGKLPYSKKYDIKNIGKPLSLDIISKIGREILLGLHYLHSMNYYHNHLHSGNIYIQNSKIVIGEIENYALNLPIKNFKLYEKLFKQAKNIDKDRFQSINEIIDIIQFGQLIYEMATGCELKMLEPDVNDYIFIPKRIAAFLKEIFPESEDKENNHLTLQDILNNSSRMSEIFANKTKNVSKIKYSLPHIKIEELLYDEFFRDENDPFYKNFKDLPTFKDQITKAFINQLNRLNYSK